MGANLSEITGGASLTSSGPALAINQFNPGATGALTITTPIVDNTGSVGVGTAGTGTTILTGANTYTGPTAVGAGGTLQFGNGTSGGMAGAGAMSVGTGATLVFNLPTAALPNTITSAGSVVGAESTGLTDTLSGNISGGTFTQSGVGTTVLSGINTFTGTTLNAGTLQVGAVASGASNIGSGGITLGGGTLNYTGPSVTLTNTITETGASTLNIANSTSTLTISQTIANSKNLTITGAGNVFFQQSVSGGYITLATGYTGTVTLSGTGDNSGTGGIVNGGTLILDKSPSALNAHSLGGSGLQIGPAGTVVFGGGGNSQMYFSAGTFTVNGTLNLNGVNTGTPATTENGEQLATISGSGVIINNGTAPFALSIGSLNPSYPGGGGNTFSGVIEDGTSTTAIAIGAGTLTLSGNNTYSGGTTVNSGTLNANSPTALGASSGTLTVGNNNNFGVTVNGSASVLNIGSTITTGSLSGAIVAPLGTGTNTATINIAASDSLTVNQTTAGTYAGVLAGAGAFNLGPLSTAALTLTGVNTYTGPTSVSGGTLNATASNIGSGSLAVSNPNTGAGTAVSLLLPTAAPTTVGSLSGLVATPISGANSATIDNGGQLLTVNQTTAGTYGGVIQNTGGFTLGASSTAALTLTGANTYTGPTNVAAGTLYVDGSHGTSLATVGAYTVASSATLGGTGTIYLGANPVSVNGELMPGYGSNGAVASPLTLNTTGALTFASGSELNVTITHALSGGADWLMAPSASVTISNTSGNSILDVIANSSVVAGDKFTLIDPSSPITGQFGTVNVTGLNPGLTYSLSYNGGGTNNLVLTVVPEPSSLVLTALAAAAFAAHQLRRRRRKSAC